MSAVVRWALAERNVDAVADAWSGRPESVHVTSMSRSDGTRLWFVSNNGWQPVEVPLPPGQALTDAATGERFAGTLSLDAWGSVVVAQG
jgi:hypothetical protein